MSDLFKLEQFSRDVFRVRRTYVDITGDLIAGVLLGQIIYWNLPNEDGKTKLRVNKQGKLWLAKGRSDWWDEIRITPKQFDRAIKILQEKNFVEVKRFKFDGSPTIHINLNISEVTRNVNSILPKDEIGIYPKVKNQFDQKGKTLTEITTKTTTNTNDYSVEFEKFWDIYPRKLDKKKAYKSFKRAIKEYSIDNILSGTKRYAKAVKNTERKYIKHPSTFINNDSFIDGVESDREISEQKKKTVPLMF